MEAILINRSRYITSMGKAPAYTLLEHLNPKASSELRQQLLGILSVSNSYSCCQTVKEVGAECQYVKHVRGISP